MKMDFNIHRSSFVNFSKILPSILFVLRFDCLAIVLVSTHHFIFHQLFRIRASSEFRFYSIYTIYLLVIAISLFIPSLVYSHDLPVFNHITIRLPYLFCPILLVFCFLNLSSQSQTTQYLNLYSFSITACEREWSCGSWL